MAAHSHFMKSKALAAGILQDTMSLFNIVAQRNEYFNNFGKIVGKDFIGN